MKEYEVGVAEGWGRAPDDERLSFFARGSARTTSREIHAELYK